MENIIEYNDKIDLKGIGLKKNLLFLKLLGINIIKGRLDISNNELEGLEGLSNEIYGDLVCLEGNKFDIDYVKKYIKKNNIRLDGKIK